MAPTTFERTEDAVVFEFDDDTLTRGEYFEAIGYISSVFATLSGAWDGEAPEWFPEPPEWVVLADEALAEVRAKNAEIDLLEEPDAYVWANEFAKRVAEDPSIATDPETLVGWFANAFQRGEWNSPAYKRETAETIKRIDEAIAQEEERERMEHPLYALVILEEVNGD